MKKTLLILLLPITILYGCSLLGQKIIEPENLINTISINAGGKINNTCFLRRYYNDIDRRITTANCYNTEFIKEMKIEYNKEI